MLQNRTNWGKNVNINSEHNNLEKSSHKKWLSFYRKKNHHFIGINQALKQKTAGEFFMK